MFTETKIRDTNRAESSNRSLLKKDSKPIEDLVGLSTSLSKDKTTEPRTSKHL